MAVSSQTGALRALAWPARAGHLTWFSGAAMSRIRDAGISVFALDADSFGRSCPDKSQRSLVRHKNHMPDDVFTFVQVKSAVHTCSHRPCRPVAEGLTACQNKLCFSGVPGHMRHAELQEVVSKKQGSPRVPIFMGGLSMGGMVTILTAIQHPELFKVCAGPASLYCTALLSCISQFCF